MRTTREKKAKQPTKATAVGANGNTSGSAAGTQSAHAEDPQSDLESRLGIERRRSTREHVITLGMLHATGVADGSSLDDIANMFRQPRQVLVTNVSLHGVGFRSPEPVDADLLYSIEIGVGPLQLSSRLRIVRVRVRPDGTYDCGAEFC